MPVSYRITVVLTPQSEGGYTVTCKELSELITEGNSIEEALNNAIDAFATVLELYDHFDRDLPDTIQVMPETIPPKKQPVWFETVTPTLPVDADVSPFFFQAIISKLESKATFL